MKASTKWRMGVQVALLLSVSSSQADPGGYTLRGLSAHTVAQVEAGAGMGMAKAADLNGYPGPRHALAMSQALSLSDAQYAALQQVMGQMTAEAQQVGRRYLAAEAELEARFRKGSVTESELAKLVRASAAAQAQLRLVHLRAHLQTRALLNENQRMLYSQHRANMPRMNEHADRHDNQHSTQHSIQHRQEHQGSGQHLKRHQQ